MTNKYEIPLVVAGNNPPPPELRVGREQRTQHPSNTHTHLTIEVVEYELWAMFRRQPMVANIFAELDVGDLEVSTSTVKFLQKQLPPSHCVPHHHHMRVFHVASEPVDLRKGELLSWVVEDARKQHHQLLQEVVEPF